MKLEIERKFLIRPALSVYTEHRLIRQTYLSVRPELRVRVTQPLESGWAIGVPVGHLTLKLPTEEVEVRKELDLEIPVEAARGILGTPQVEKIRFYYPNGWTVDQYLESLKGLWIAEIELSHPRAPLPEHPFEVIREVTAEPEFKNVALATQGLLFPKFE